MKLGCDRSIRDDRQFAEDRNNGGRFQGIIATWVLYQGFGNAVGRVRGRPRGTAGSNTTWTEFPMRWMVDTLWVIHGVQHS